jgi:hypothetical protein
MSPDQVRIAETRSWLVKAARDLRAAVHEFRASPPLLDDIVFHCQQSVEKTFKAFLTWHDIPFQPTRQEADDAYALADEIYGTMLGRLPEETHP